MRNPCNSTTEIWPFQTPMVTTLFRDLMAKGMLVTSDNMDPAAIANLCGDWMWHLGYFDRIRTGRALLTSDDDGEEDDEIGGDEPEDDD